MATKSRRTVKTTDKKDAPAKAQSAAKIDPTFPGNIVVQRRMSGFGVTETKVAKAAKEFQEGKAISEIVSEYGFARTPHAEYALKQHLVATGVVKPLPATKTAVQAALKSGEYCDLAWIACRTGLAGPARSLLASAKE